MLYIKLSDNDEILDIDFSPSEDLKEISLHDPKLAFYIQNSENSDEIIQKVLNNLDLSMVRVIEDVIDIMIDKNMMLFTDLPDAVQNKILFKKAIRSISNKDTSIIEDTEELNF